MVLQQQWTNHVSGVGVMMHVLQYGNELQLCSERSCVAANHLGDLRAHVHGEHLRLRSEAT